MPQAVFITGEATIEVKEVAKLSPGPGQVLVRVHAAGLNPADWKMAHMLWQVALDTIPGSDFAGTIEEIGSAVPDGVHSIGKRVAGGVYGYQRKFDNLPPLGAFSEYVVVDADLVWAIPDNMTYEVATTQTLAALTAAQILWQSLNAPTPEAPAKEPTPLLVWSAASGVGHWLLQFAHLSGLKVYATASQKHSERLKALGAVDVFDYRDPEAGKKIFAATKGSLTQIAVAETTQDDVVNIINAFGDNGGIFAACAPFLQMPNSTKPVEFVPSIVMTLYGEPLAPPFNIPALPEHRAAAAVFIKRIEKLVSEGKISTLPVRVFNGLESVWQGMEELRTGKVSGERIAFKIVA
ncbi:GroES-like protein [Exidia glandulosa HHB12029]|uniref:GroES-like protein n=1 Tax=Exidia glandulosa HHB12029 TaxID=1314781 RepID=A0A165HZX9_EXIGL|nr:GroES-like protein [Exidia glandulosa HHB12029]